MPELNRRRFLATIPAAAVVLRSEGAPPAPPAFSAQLNTVRGPLRTDPDGTLKAVAAMGFKEVEGYTRLSTIALLPKLKQYGLAVRTCVVETPLLTNNWEPFPELTQLSLPAAILSVAETGAEFFALGYIPPGARGDGEDFFRRTADRMNSAAELCKKSGLKLAWQNHAFEFAGRPGFRCLFPSIVVRL